MRIGAGVTEEPIPELYFTGSIDDIRIYNRALSEVEVQALYELEKPGETSGLHTVDLNSTVDLEMIWVEPGTFTMGSPITEGVGEPMKLSTMLL